MHRNRRQHHLEMISPGALQEVVVTARRQSEDLEKVPLAVTALSTSALAEQHVTNEQELQTAEPGLLTVASTSTNQLAFSIRGQALDAYSYTSPTVLTYFDEFQTGGTTATTFFDLQSVQVLKGPQGTLFGRNATGGAVLYTTTQPGKQFEGYFNYTAGNFNEQKVEGAVTIPLAEWASVRLAAEDEHRDGYEHNLYLDVDEGSIDNRNFRGTLLLTPLDALENTTTVQYGRQGGDSGALKIVSANVNCPPSPSCAAAELFPPGVPTGGTYPAKLASYNGLLNFIAMESKQPFWNVWNDSDDRHDAQLKEAVNRTTYTVNDDLSIKNIVGYNQVVSRDRLDTDGSPFEILTSGAIGGPNPEGILYSTEQYSEELQLAGTALAKRLNYLVGGYYERDNEGENAPLNVGCGSIAFPVTPQNPAGCEVPGGIRYNFENDEESRALFGQATYEFIDNLRATAGYRETWEDINFRYVDDGSVPEDAHQLAGVPLPPILSEGEPSWTLGLDYQLTPETLLYLAQRGGFRVGGFNGASIVQTSTGATNIDSFKPEIARDLELGIKYAGRLGGFPVRINADVYRGESERCAAGRLFRSCRLHPQCRQNSSRWLRAGCPDRSYILAAGRARLCLHRRALYGWQHSFHAGRRHHGRHRQAARLSWGPTPMQRETRAPSICASRTICRTRWANWWCARTSTRRATSTIRTSPRA